MDRASGELQNIPDKIRKVEAKVVNNHGEIQNLRNTRLGLPQRAEKESKDRVWIEAKEKKLYAKEIELNGKIQKENEKMLRIHSERIELENYKIEVQNVLNKWQLRFVHLV